MSFSGSRSGLLLSGELRHQGAPPSEAMHDMDDPSCPALATSFWGTPASQFGL